MASIGDFVNHRWTDAKEALRILDGGFVGGLESEIRLRTRGVLAARWGDGEPKPKRRLPSKWHRLLEACLELTMQMKLLQTAADGLKADAHIGMSRLEVGIRADYYFRSWFMHAAALTERTNEVIKWTTNVYVPEHATRTKLAEQQGKRVHEQITEAIERQRDQYLHGAIRSWAKGITEDQLWEGSVAVGLTPQRFLDEVRFPKEERQLRSGKHAKFVPITGAICDGIGSILQDLETDMNITDP